MKTKQQKSEELNALRGKIPASKITVFTSFARSGEKGLSVAQMTELRKLLRSLGAEFLVTKKTLIDRAFKQIGDFKILDMIGSMGLAMGGEDAYTVAKKIYEFAKKNPALQFFGAMFDGKYIGHDEFIEIAKLPSREMIIARLFGMMKYPISSLAIVLKEVAKKKEATA
jgi:large subunit ribosomal protein L10